MSPIYTKKKTKVAEKTIKSIAKKEAKKVVAQNVESKWFQYIGTLTPTNVVAWTGGLTDVAQGDGNGQRNGDKIMPKKLKFTLAITAGDPTNFIRCLVVRWRDNDSGAIGSPFDADKVLQVGASSFIDWTSDYLYSNKKNFDILYDKTWTFVQQADTHIRIVTKTIKLGKVPVVYNPTALTGTGRLFFLYLSDSGVVSHPEIDVASTFFYTDA